jgi:hypothetical protein
MVAGQLGRDGEGGARVEGCGGLFEDWHPAATSRATTSPPVSFRMYSESSVSMRRGKTSVRKDVVRRGVRGVGESVACGAGFDDVAVGAVVDDSPCRRARPLPPMDENTPKRRHVWVDPVRQR